MQETLSQSWEISRTELYYIKPDSGIDLTDYTNFTGMFLYHWVPPQFVEPIYIPPYNVGGCI